MEAGIHSAFLDVFAWYLQHGRNVIRAAADSPANMELLFLLRGVYTQLATLLSLS